MDFKNWFLKEEATSTSSIAVFARPIFGGPIRRTWPSLITGEHKKRKKKKR